MSVINDFYAKESIFFHIIEGQLRQRVDLFIDFIDFADDNLSRDESVTAIIETDAGKFGQCVTKVELTREMPLPLIFWAPVVYPNIIDGTHKPIDAQIKITVDDNVTEKSFELGARRPWTVYALTDDCADFTWGYSGEETIKNSTDFIGAHLRWIEQTKDYPHEIQNRYNINQVMEAEWFRKSLPQNYFDLLIQAIKSGHMQLSPAYNSSNTAMLHTEQLVRTLYCGRKYESEYGIDISVAQEIESPVCTWGLASIFAGAGIKYLIRNWLNYYSPYCKDRDQPPLYKWVGPDGNGIIVLSDTDSCMKYGYKGARAFIKETYEKAVEELHGWWIPNFEKNAKYSYSALPMTGAYWDLNPSTASEVEIFVNQLRQYNNENWEYPQIINATWNQYFSHIEKQTAEHGLIIPEYRGDFGSAWEEWPAGLAHILSSMRCGINEYLAVETFSAMATTEYPALLTAIRGYMDTALERMEQIGEHPWNGSANWEKVEASKRKAAWCNDLIAASKKIKEETVRTLFGGTLISDDYDPNEYLIVVNSLSWKRNGIIKIKAREELQVFDISANMKLLSDYCTSENILTFTASDLPAIGYKIYRFEKMAFTSPSKNKLCGNVIENDFYRIHVNAVNGSISSIFDKKNNRELVNQSHKFGVNQYVYLSEDAEYDFDNIEKNLDNDKIYKLKIKTDWYDIVESVYNSNNNRDFLAMKETMGKDQSITLTQNTEYILDSVKTYIEANPVYKTLRIKGKTHGTVLETRITLYDNIDLIEIDNRLRKIPSIEPQEIHFFFSFNVPGGRCHYDGPASVTRPENIAFGGDHLNGSGRQIYSVNNYADVSNDDFGIVLSAIDSTLIQFGERTTRKYPLEPDIPDNTILSLVMTNKQPEMIKDQAGNNDFRFRYAIKSHKGKYQAHESFKTGVEANVPPLCLSIKQFDSINNSKCFQKTYFNINRDDVVVSAFKPAELEPDAVVIRLRDISGTGGELIVDLKEINPVKVTRCNIVEKDIEELSNQNGKIKLTITAMGFVTIKLYLKYNVKEIQLCKNILI